LFPPALGRSITRNIRLDAAVKGDRAAHDAAEE
jgi:hypothetical protein